MNFEKCFEYDSCFGTNNKKLAFYCKGNKKEYDELNNYSILWERNIKWNNNIKSNKKVVILSEKNEKLKNKKLKYEMLKYKVTEFKIQCNSIGNFLVMPKGLKKDILQNEKIKKQYDLYLKLVKNFYKNNYEYVKKEYISLNVYENLKKYEDYFKLFNTFENYVNDNYLNDFLDKDGNVIELFKRKDGKLLPNTYKEVIEYLQNAKLIISRRNNKMKVDLSYIHLKNRISKIIQTNYNIGINRLDFIENIKEFKLYDNKSLGKFLTQSGKYYFFISEEEYDDVIAIKKIIDNKATNLLDKLKSAKVILINITIGKYFKYQYPNEFKNSLKYIIDNTNASCSLKISTNLEQNDTIQMAIMISGCEE